MSPYEKVRIRHLTYKHSPRSDPYPIFDSHPYIYIYYIYIYIRSIWDINRKMIILRLSHQAAHLPLRRKRGAHSDTTSSAAGAMRTTSKATIPPRMTSWWNFWRRSWRESVGFWRKKVQTWCEILPKNVYVSFHRFLYIYIYLAILLCFFFSLSLSLFCIYLYMYIYQ